MAVDFAEMLRFVAQTRRLMEELPEDERCMEIHAEATRILENAGWDTD